MDEPEGAKALINGVSEGTTSNEIKVRPTLGKREVTLQKEGYEF
ncbi:PEGA domain-containing protein [Marinilabilia sp.]